MRIHTFNRRAIQEDTKGLKLRGQKIGGQGLTKPRCYRARGYSFPQFPARMPSTSGVIAIHSRMAKKGIFSRCVKKVGFR